MPSTGERPLADLIAIDFTELVNVMTRTVQCLILKEEAEGLDRPPYPGALGKRIFEHISREGWLRWLERLTTIINENGLNSADLQSLRTIEQHMQGFLFGEGKLGGLPPGFVPQGQKK
ncbi:MAG: oxidative damage protection protein [Methylococcales bacterium]